MNLSSERQEQLRTQTRVAMSNRSYFRSKAEEEEDKGVIWHAGYWAGFVEGMIVMQAIAGIVSSANVEDL